MTTERAHPTEGVPTPQAPTPRPRAVAPGSADAPAAGCTCPTVANIGYRMGIDPLPLLDPGCPLHRPERGGDGTATAAPPQAAR